MKNRFFFLLFLHLLYPCVSPAQIHFTPLVPADDQYKQNSWVYAVQNLSAHACFPVSPCEIIQLTLPDSCCESSCAFSLPPSGELSLQSILTKLELSVTYSSDPSVEDVLEAVTSDSALAVLAFLDDEEVYSYGVVGAVVPGGYFVVFSDTALFVKENFPGPPGLTLAGAFLNPPSPDRKRESYPGQLAGGVFCEGEQQDLVLADSLHAQWYSSNKHIPYSWKLMHNGNGTQHTHHDYGDLSFFIKPYRFCTDYGVISPSNFIRVRPLPRTALSLNGPDTLCAESSEYVRWTATYNAVLPEVTEAYHDIPMQFTWLGYAEEEFLTYAHFKFRYGKDWQIGLVHYNQCGRSDTIFKNVHVYPEPTMRIIETADSLRQEIPYPFMKWMIANGFGGPFFTQAIRKLPGTHYYTLELEDTLGCDFYSDYMTYIGTGIEESIQPWKVSYGDHQLEVGRPGQAFGLMVTDVAGRVIWNGKDHSQYTVKLDDPGLYLVFITGEQTSLLARIPVW